MCRNIIHYHQDNIRHYWLCKLCSLVFVDASEYLTGTQEQAYYDQHENHINNPGYRNFLNRLATPLLKRLSTNQCDGLDFGCGPGPALADMLTKAGKNMRLYDHFYVPDTSVWQTEYDFITCTEVIEHLHHPAIELERLFRHLRPGGWLGIMTKRVRDSTAFQNWHYIRDPTHVAFYSNSTFSWIAQNWHLELDFVDDDVVLLQIQ